MTKGRHRQWSLGKTLYKRSHKCNKTPKGPTTKRAAVQTGPGRWGRCRGRSTPRPLRHWACAPASARAPCPQPVSAPVLTPAKRISVHRRPAVSAQKGREELTLAKQSLQKAGGCTRLGRKSLELTLLLLATRAVLLQQPCQLLLSSFIFPREQITTWMLNTLK